MTSPSVAVVGQLARDLVLPVDRIPDAGASASADDRWEQLGGKGANQAVALAQLGGRPRLVAVAGDDVIGDVLLDQARRDGIDVRGVVRRPGTLTGLIVELLSGDGYRYVEHLPLLDAADVTGAATVLREADAVLVQAQQPAGVVVAAARLAAHLVVIDGVPPQEAIEHAGVLRMDDAEAEIFFGFPPDDPDRLAAAADAVLRRGPKLIAVALTGGGGNLMLWEGGHAVIPLTGEKTVDTTGGGDAFVAALTLALLRGASPVEAGCWASAASGATVGHVSGRPRLTREALAPRAAGLRAQVVAR